MGWGENMKASRAAFLAREAKEAGLNAYRNQILKDIEAAARNGETYINVDAPLRDGTVTWLTDLGYKVVQPEIKYFKAYGAPLAALVQTQIIRGSISWD